MHEMSLTQGVLRILEEQAAQHGFSRVRTVWLEIGQLSHVDPDAMLFCFEAVAKGTALAREARMEVVRVPGQGYCLDCSQTVTLAQRHDPCPACGGYHLAITAGDELKIKELEVE